MSIEAMKLGLEALERSVATCFDQYAHNEVMSRPEHFVNQAITALRQAIEQAQKQEQQHPMMDMPHDQKILHAYGYHKPQRQWVGLTDDEIWKDDAIMSANSGYGATFDTLRDVVRAVEAKLKEKNT